MMEPIARHGRQRRHSAAAAILRLLGIGIVVAIVSGISVAAIASWQLTSSLKPSVDLVGQDEVPPSIGAIPGGVNLLLVGSDSAQGDPAFGERGENLNDVTMLLHIAADHSNATILSFPRDLYVDVPECPLPDGDTGGDVSGVKLNTALYYGGLPCAVLTVQELTGLSIPYAALIEFQGVIEMSNAVGGVTVCVAERIEDEHTGTFLDPGENTLQGIAALQFLRTRYGLASGTDTARISNQQVFLSALARTVKSDETLTNPAKVYAVAQAALSNMTMSTSLQHLDTIASIALALKDVPLDRIALVQFPTYEADGGLYTDSSDAAAVIAAVANDQAIALTGTTGSGSQVDPNAPAAPAPTPAPTDSATPVPEVPTVALPVGVHGQTASQQTCSVGRPLGDQ